MDAYDKHRRPMRIGDLLKVYHFTAALRRQKYYAYQQITSESGEYLTVSHLDPAEDTYIIRKNDKINEHYEIIQSWCGDFKKREKKG